MIAERRRRTGPAPFSPEERRGVQITVSFRQDEIALVDTRCATAGIGRSVWIRQCSLAEAGVVALRPVVVTPLNAIAWGKLARSAANLNQIARHLNQDVNLDMADVEDALRQFRDRLLSPQAWS